MQEEAGASSPIHSNWSRSERRRDTRPNPRVLRGLVYRVYLWLLAHNRMGG